MNLINQKCVPCEGGQEPLTKKEAESLLSLYVKDWELKEDAKKLFKSFQFKDFKEALVFVNKVGELAEQEGHHPDIHLINYKNVEIDLFTHAIDGLSQNDFIVAAKVNNL